MKKQFEMYDCVMNNKTGKVYRISSNNKQTRNRWQLRGFELRCPASARIVESKLTYISERIERWKHRLNDADKEILLMARAIRNKIIH